MTSLDPTTHSPTSQAGASTARAPRLIPNEVYDLFGRIKRLERKDGSWPGADTASLLCEWFTELGVDPDADPRDYAPAGSYTSPEGTVYSVQRQTADGLYLFVDPHQAAEYAALFEGAQTSPETIIGRSAAAQLIIDNQPCQACGDPDGCGPCPAGDPGCDALECQRHDTCTVPVAVGSRVALTDEADGAGCEALTGVVAEPTADEASERPEGATLLVEWPHHRHWEDLADLTVLDDTSGLHW